MGNNRNKELHTCFYFFQKLMKSWWLNQIFLRKILFFRVFLCLQKWLQQKAGFDEDCFFRTFHLQQVWFTLAYSTSGCLNYTRRFSMNVKCVQTPVSQFFSYCVFSVFAYWYNWLPSCCWEIETQNSKCLAF